MLVALGVAGGLLTAFFGFLIGVVWDETEPVQSQVCCSTPADWGEGSPGAGYRNVELASHGETLTGWYVPSGNTAAVILLHPGGFHRMGVMREGRILASEGFGVLMYDRRAHGESTGDRDSSGWYDAQDVPAAIDFLARQPEVDADRIGIFGASIGGQVALRAAAADPRIRAAMADGPSLCGVRDHLPLTQLPPRMWGLRLASVLARPLFEIRLKMRTPPAVVDVIGDIAPRPLLLIATGDLEHKIVERYYWHAGEPKTLWHIPEAGHGGGYAARPEEYRRKLVDFFERSLVHGDWPADR